MSRAILDTSVLIDTTLEPLPGRFAISVISTAELSYGVLVTADTAERSRRLARLVRVQRLFDALPVDEAVSESYGRLASQVASTGRNPRARVMDLLIAATAHAHGASLYTRNSGDLRGLEDVVDIVAL